ncbi:MAG: MopE-related protein, partial [Actinomycetota bacterium]|nr:MopE-related protein [Actinomycetota bacterium]
MIDRAPHLVAALALALIASPASAQVRPRIVVAFDTSGSMALDVDGVPTFGDGVLTGCSTRAWGGQCGTNCTAGIDTDCDGRTDDSRMYVAKNALSDIVLAYGDVDWALARFHQEQSLNRSCLRAQDFECRSGPSAFVTSYGNPQCNTGLLCNRDWGSLIPAECRPGDNGDPELYVWAGGSPTVCTNYSGTCTGGDVLVGFSDVGPWAGLDNTYGILGWLDGAETNFVNTTTTGNYCSHVTTGDCELRPEGATPLAGLLTSVSSYVSPIRSSDAAAACRPYSVILLTDGAESCGGDPVDAARDLRAAGIPTYVVGLAIDSASEDSLNAIATAGGTDAGSSGGDTAYFANDPFTLSAGLADIVQRSLVFETCNGLDDDCDTRIDEGVLNACGACGAVPSETCNGADDDCDTRTDEGVSNACGTCGAAPSETCNGLDDDCDGSFDEGACTIGCTPTTEICDNLDNDCDTRIDEGPLTRSCGVDVGECTTGTQTCSAGAWGSCAGSVGPVAETCDNRDNDCDGVIDGMSRACGTSTGACEPGSQLCAAGGWGTCTGGVTPTSEICNAIDDDCDGTIDDGTSGTGGACGSSIGVCDPGTVQCVAGALTCVGGTSPGSETCNATDDDCDGRTDESVPTMGACGSGTGECSPGVMTCVSGTFSCIGARGPRAELCNTRDDDCDGTTDEGNPGGGLACGTATGECALGTSQCVAGTLTCTGGITPAAETCNTRDDDCDGLVDEGNPGGGAACGSTDVGLCELGALACVSGSLTCVGGIGPNAEQCDGLDNDCDGMVDEGDPEGGMACGDGTGECAPGTTRCIAGALACEGAVGPSEEMCNALDDDCDTLVDEGTGLGEACGTDVGECVPGFNVCEAGMVVCRGAVGPVAEACNGLDDDCDASTDEGLGVGGACGVDEGLCMAGVQQCIDGALVCVGETGPTPEGCDCEDNDCDATVDEAPPGGSLCPMGSACVECQCALPCVDSEFGPTCPTGRTPFTEGGVCHCVAPRCDDASCGTETITRDGEVLCAPDGEDVANCVCRNNECTFSCDGVVCAGGTVCNPRDTSGRCVEDSCIELGCPGGEVCDPSSGDCVADPCATITCDPAEVCRAGVCEPSCATVMCAGDERCERGVCVEDRCADVTCASGEVCDPADGSCVDDGCVGVTCPAGTECDPLTGDCEADACIGVRCPEGETCEAGECTRPIVRPDAGVDAGIDGGHVDTDEEARVLAAGGGGCFCTVGAGADRRAPTPGALAMVLLVALGLLVRRARRRSRSVRPLRAIAGAAIVALALVTSGCDVDPYCLTCTDDDAGPADAGPGDAGPGDAGRDAGARDAGPPDAGLPDGCVPGAPELCNVHDDDCDMMVDEGIDTTTDEMHCGGCGLACAPPGAFGECVAGVCTIAMCDVGRFDRDGDPSNGCETRCLPTATDDTLCDLRDNDCDFMVDEDVDLSTDASNCGRCGRTCRFIHAAATCEPAAAPALGACALGACEAGYYDIDGVASNGCEYACTAADPAVETCNGRDDDCDGAVDEGDPGGGGSCGTNAGECTAGVEQCVMGRVTCIGGVSPVVEACNGLDDDCDGTSDESNPEGGRICGSSVGACVAGREQCTGGALVCVGATPPGTESCNGLDDDCDASIDEGDPGGGGSCGTSTGACSSGTNHCRGGVIACEGGTGAVSETCNGADDDC